MTTTWTIAIDWDRNGNYSGTYDDVTSRVLSAQWFLGMQTAYEDMADNAMLKLELDNADKRFSPEYGSSPIAGKVVPFRPIRIQSNDGTTTRTHWVGWVETIQPDLGIYGERLAHVVATGPNQFLHAAQTKLQLQENKLTSEVINQLVSEVVFPPALTSAWILGRTGNSEVGQTTILADLTLYSNIDTGILRLAMAGDNWVDNGGLSNKPKNAFEVFQAIQDITAAERGKFLFSREGKAMFWNRHRLLQGGTAAATFTDNMNDMIYSYGHIDQTKNEIIVTCHPRVISPNTTDILWDLGTAVIEVAPGETREIYINYESADGQRVGARQVTVTGVTLQTGTATVTVDARANGAVLKLVNVGSTLAIVNACKVQGQKITDYGEMEASAVDALSIVDYGRRALRINLPSIDNVKDAQYIADFERDRRGQPRGMVHSITVRSHAQAGGGQHAQQLARTLGDLVTIAETQSGHSKDYYIIGEAHELTDSATLLDTTWYLEPAPDTYPWKLDTVGRSELGTTTILTI
jgi:hypothetical protein